MAAFPVLKTGAIVQYPSERGDSFSTDVLEFIDGSEQRSALYGAPLKRWLVRLDLLSEGELFQLEQFFVEQGGASGTFSFTDPWDDTEYTDCSFEDDEISLVFEAVGAASASVVIKENR